MSIFAVFAFVVLLVFVACNEKQINEPVHTGAVSGYFVTEDGNPISSATVEVTDAEGKLVYSGITAENGSFTIENIPQDAENSIVSFSKGSRVLQQLRLKTLMNITGISGKRGDVFLEEDYDYDATQMIKVVDKITQQPLENALIQLGTSQNAIMEFRTDSEGMVTLKVIRYCIYPVFKISKDGYINSTMVFYRYINEYDNWVAELEPIFEPDGTTNNSINVLLVQTLIGTPIIYRQVNIVGDNGYRDSAITDGDYHQNNYGRVKFEGLKSGVYKVFFDPIAGDYEKSELEIQLAGNKAEDIFLYAHRKTNLCNNNTLIVNFKDENGNAINSGSVIINTFNEGYYPPEPVKFSNGKAVFTGISKGEHTFHIREIDCDDVIYRSSDFIKNVRFDCNETVTKEVTLVVHKVFDENCCDNVIQFFLYDATGLTPPHGEPPRLPNQKIVITDTKGNTRTTYSSNLGEFQPGLVYFENVCFGTYTVTLESDEYEAMFDEYNINEPIKLRCGEAGGKYIYARRK